MENLPPGYDYEKIECYMQGVRDYIKFIKRGYTRPSHLASIDIRNGRMSREDGLRMIKAYEGKRPPSLDLFLDYIGIDENEFNEILHDHAVSPYKHDFSNLQNGKKLKDFSDWSKDGKMDRNESKIQLKRWKERFI